MKGEFEKGCYKKSCIRMVSDWLNHKNGKYYCWECARMINIFNPEFKEKHGFKQCEKVKQNETTKPEQPKENKPE